MSCSSSNTTDGEQPAVGENEISLRTESVFAETPILEAPQYNETEPGEGNEKFARSFYDAPPLVPHKVEDTATGEDCLDCHEEGDEETPGVSNSHKIKAVIKMVTRENTTSGQLHEVQGFAKVEEGINNERYNCTTCHVPQAMNLDPLVENEFSKVQPANAKKDILEDLNTFQY